MKHRLLLTLSACALMFCLLLTACGQQNTNGAATKDSATADSAETVSAAAPANTPTAEPAKEADSSSSSASSSAASPAQNTPDVVGNSDDVIVREEDTPVQEEQQEEPEQEEQRSSSSAPQSSSKASPASQGNPAYADSDKPVFTITLTNKSTKQSYSASCNYTTDKEEVATAAFFLPGGEYDVAVYHYTEGKDKGDPVAQATYKNNIADTKRRSIHVNYTPKDSKIEVAVSASSRNQ